ncbi:MAG TPA: ferredoxin [Acholeplasmatales bacterium]|nr:MAG: ferredoxin [Tenericutes bacterium GWF2_57_13]HAQ57383.1 ferredoxin [Acholeplasmatales bacterium]
MARIEFTLNREPVVYEGDAARRLIDVIRDDFGLKGTKEGCGEGECGACSVLVDRAVVPSCLYPVANVAGRAVVTIEDFRNTKRYQVLQTAFLEEGAVQCGFCTPGMIIAAEALLSKDPHPTAEEITIGLSGNLCRCTGYNMIIRAILRAAKDGDGLW